ncbi:MAG: peroxiredoxin [Acidimicrobiales bacterium]
MVRPGDTAPDISLPGTYKADGGRRTYTLAEYRGRPVVLVFYPGDHTPVCTRQLETYTNDIELFREVDAQVLAISPQSVDSHEKFSCGSGGFGFPLLADEDKEVGHQYGVPGPLGFYRRSVFVVDADGVVRYVHRARNSLVFRPTDELVAAVRHAAVPS